MHPFLFRYLRGWRLSLLLYVGLGFFLLGVLGFGALQSWITARQLINDVPYFLVLSVSMGTGHQQILRILDRKAWIGWRWGLAIPLLVLYTLAVGWGCNYLFLIRANHHQSEYLSLGYVLRKSIAPFYTAQLLLGVYLVKEMWEQYGLPRLMKQ
jgi:hypothetical protein